MNRLRQARLARGWTQFRLLVALEEAARELHIPVATRASLKAQISRWENGHAVPDPPYRRLFSHVFDCACRELGLPDADAPSPRDHAAGAQIIQLPYAARPEEDQMERRNLLTGSSALGALTFVGPTGPHRVGMAEVREVATSARSLQRWDRQYGGWLPYQAAVGSVDGALRLVRGTYTERVGQRLLPAVADLCAVTGWICYDVGRHQDALRYFTFGVQVAHQGGDAAVAARLLGDMARVNADLGQPMQSAELLGLAAHVARAGTPATVLAKLLSMEAKTYAILGQRQACLRAVGRAQEQFARARPADDPAWIAYFDEAQLAGVVGSCYRDLSARDRTQAAKAEVAIHQAMATRGDEQVRNRALDTINLATARLRHGELDGLCEAGEAAVELAGQLKSHRVVMRLSMLADQARPQVKAHPGLATLVEHIASEVSYAGWPSSR